MRIFCELRSKNTSNEQTVRSYYMLNHRIRGLLFHYKKTCYFAIDFYFFGKSQFRNILIPSVRMTLTVCKMFARVICQTIEWEVNYFIANEKMLFLLLFSSKSIQNILILSVIVAPFASAGIRPFVNRLNQDTTVYYGLVFWAFSWPCMVKWHNSGIIKKGIFYIYHSYC